MKGAGKNPNVSNDAGWDDAWNALMPADAESLSKALMCSGWPMWTAQAGSTEAYPVNCVTWYEAAAFCMWDGGVLPTEVEWNFAASGGNDQRAWPWTLDPDAGVTSMVAVYGFSNGPFPVGNADGGEGRWLHQDLAGNVAEWNYDVFTGTPPMPCDHRANLTGGVNRLIHDSGWNTTYGELINMQTSARRSEDPQHRDDYTGFRCARGCVEGLMRCSPSTGQPQKCVNGQWMDQAPCSEDLMCMGNGICSMA
jgi:formylglycine-generating enzyme